LARVSGEDVESERRQRKIRNGMKIAVSRYWLPTAGMTKKAIASIASTAMRSWRIGKICWSCAYETLYWPASR
jgi:hypothetical protein